MGIRNLAFATAAVSAVALTACATSATGPGSEFAANPQACEAQRQGVANYLRGPAPSGIVNPNDFQALGAMQESLNRDVAALVIAKKCADIGDPLLYTEDLVRHARQSKIASEYFSAAWNTNMRINCEAQYDNAYSRGMQVSRQTASICAAVGVSPR